MFRWRDKPWILMLGTAAAVGLGLQMRRAEQARLVAGLRTDLAVDARLLGQALDRVEDRLWATQSLFRASEQVEAHEFAGLAASMANDLPWLRAIEFRSSTGSTFRHPPSPHPIAVLEADTAPAADRLRLAQSPSGHAPARHALVLATSGPGSAGTLVYWVELQRLVTELLGGHDARAERRLHLGAVDGPLLAAVGAPTAVADSPGLAAAAAEPLRLGDARLIVATGLDRTQLAERTSWAPWTAAGVVLLLSLGLQFWRRHQRRLHAEVEAQVHRRTQELAAATAAGARSEARAQAFFELGVVGLAELAADGTIRRCNQEFAAMAGHPAERLVGRPYAELLQERHGAEFTRRLQAFADGRLERHTGLVDLQRADSQPAPVSIGVRAMRDADPSVAALLLAQIDMREYSRMLEELRAAMHLADAANRAKSEFLANMSHELRTPLTAILGFTQVLLDAEPDAVTSAQLAVVARNGEHLLGVLGDILDLAKIEAGRLETRQEPVDLVALVDDVLSVLRPRALAKGLALAVQRAADAATTLRSDPTRLRQIVFNLVDNAVKFTTSGRIEVRVETPLVGQRRRLRLSVEDTGLGLSPAQLDGLFQPFVQVDGSDRRRFGGTGLGLAISQRLAGLLGGRIEVQSTPELGSTFTLDVDGGDLGDTSSLAQPAPQASRTGAAGKHRSARILVVDDGLDNQQLLRTILQRAGHSVAVAADGEQAVREFAAAQARHEPFDLVIMDMQMPVLDGYAATAQLRADGARTPILACTARAMPDDRDRCLAVGCDDYVAKPVRPRQLVATITALLGAQEGAPDGTRDGAGRGAVD